MIRSRGYRGDNLNHIWAILLINLLVFIAAIINRNLIIALLGLRTASFFAQPWTILTNIFTHVEIWHILANMVTLYFFGRFLTGLIGAKKLLIVYFCGGILGNIFFMLLAPPFYTAIGASGAVFALGGTLTVLTPKLKVLVFPIPAPIPLWVAIIGGFIILSLFPGIAWQAHLGGLICGLLAGFYFRKRVRLLFY